MKNNFDIPAASHITQTLSPDEEFNNSRLLIARNCYYSLDDYETRLNNNVLVVGGSGTGKTSTIVIPNLSQAVGSYIISDPKGNLHTKFSRRLKNAGYDVININFTSPQNSAHYNPLCFVKTTQDIIKIADIIVNEKASQNSRADPYWDSMTTILLSSIIGYMVYTKYEPFNFSGILNLVREGARGDDDDFGRDSKLSKRFDALKAENPNNWASAQFENVNCTPFKTYDTIRSTLCAKFSKFDTIELQTMMSKNDLDFEKISRHKTAVFVTVSDTDRSMDALANIFFTQTMQQLCGIADKQKNSRLPVPVRFFLDDFATNCKIDEFPRMISTIRSRGISVMLMIQAESQLVQGYSADSDTIIANCDTYVYLGGNDYKTAESVARRCNKPISQILFMPVGSCWVFRRGSDPVSTSTLSPELYAPRLDEIRDLDPSP